MNAIAGQRGEAGAAEAVREHSCGSPRVRRKRDVRWRALEWSAHDGGGLRVGCSASKRDESAEPAEEFLHREKELLAAAADHRWIFGRTVPSNQNVNARPLGDLEGAGGAVSGAAARVSSRPSARRHVRINVGLAPLAGARVQTALGAEYRRQFKAADAKNRPTTAQLYADALEALVTRAGKGKALKTTLVVVADYDLVADQLANPRLADGTPLAADEFMRLALEAEILPALFDTEGQPLWLGRAYRDASEAQRIALAVRDKGCVGCGMANSFCEPHHVKYWENGGPTDIDNLCLLCGHCHHKEIHSKRGAEILREPRGKFTMQRPHHRRNDVNQPLRR